MTRAISLRGQIQAASKRRKKSNRPAAKSIAKISATRMASLARDHEGILFAVESTILQCFREDNRIDDSIVLKVLALLIFEEPPHVMPQAWLYAELVRVKNDVFDADPELTETIWQECVSCIMRSVRDHSTLEAGETNYLQFVGSFLRD